MSRSKLRKQRDIVTRASELADAIRDALAQPASAADDAEVIDAVWQADGLGMLAWALGLVEVPPYDHAFDAEMLLQLVLERGTLRGLPEIENARETARLWHWRGRTAMLMEMAGAGLPERWRSFEQLVAATAMRGHEQGLLPTPLRGDFPAFGRGYREIGREQRIEVLSIAYERHRALNWLCGLGTSWDETPTDT